MSDYANMMQDMYYAHSQNYYYRLWMLEEIMGLSSSLENVEEQVVQYEDLLRRYGARTDLSREALKRKTVLQLKTAIFCTLVTAHRQIIKPYLMNP